MRKYAPILISPHPGNFYRAAAMDTSPRFPAGDASLTVAPFWLPNYDLAQSTAITALEGRHTIPADKVRIFACQYRTITIDPGKPDTWKTVPISAVSPEAALRALGACLSLDRESCYETRLASKREYISMRAYLAEHDDDDLPPSMLT